MPQSQVISIMPLPPDADCGEGLKWLTRMRRLLSRWEDLPGHPAGSMPPEVKQLVSEKFNEMERSIRQVMETPDSV